MFMVYNIPRVHVSCVKNTVFYTQFTYLYTSVFTVLRSCSPNRPFSVVFERGILLKKESLGIEL